LKAAQVSNLAQQSIALPNGTMFVIKVQIRRSGSGGFGRTRAANEALIWSLVDGTNTVWEYSTTDLELICNLIEEAVYATGPQSAVSSSTDLGSTFAREQSTLNNSSHSSSGGSFAQQLANSALANQPLPNPIANTPIGMRSEARTAALMKQQSTTMSGGMQLSGDLSELGDGANTNH
jgi:hypothetical protein